MADNTSVIPVGYVGPNLDSATKLGAGTYSLNKRSNVPYVSLVGSAGYKKTITWGELVDVPNGQLVTVHNASYHGGDIFVNKGRDICNRPSRITVPVPHIFHYMGEPDSSGEAPAYYGCVYPCDTRGARRAYLNIDAYIAFGTGHGVFVRGRRLDGSMHTQNYLTLMSAPFGPGVGYLTEHFYTPSDRLAYIPLGEGALPTDDSRPHLLLDASDVFISLGFGSVPFDPHEVFVWPADDGMPGYPPTGPSTPFPSSWYIVEY